MFRKRLFPICLAIILGILNAQSLVAADRGMAVPGEGTSQEDGIRMAGLLDDLKPELFRMKKRRRPRRLKNEKNFSRASAPSCPAARGSITRLR